MQQTILASSISHECAYVDKTLINPFDLLIHKSDIWVTVTGSKQVNKYCRSGKLQGSVTIPNSPTGITYSKCDKSIFVATTEGVIYKLCGGETPQVYITPGGYLAGLAWLHEKLYVAVQSMTINTNGTVQNVNNGSTYVSSNGIIVNNIVSNDTNNNMVSNVMSNNVTVPRGFVAVYSSKTQDKLLRDTDLASSGYQPYGVRTIGNNIYITWSTNTTTGRQGYGYVSVYCPWSNQIIRIINRSNLSMPYGIIACDISDYKSDYKYDTRDKCDRYERRKDRCDKRINHVNKLYIGNKGTGSVSTFENVNMRESCSYQYTKDITTPYQGILVNDGLGGMDVCRKTGDIYFVAANDNGRMGSLGILYNSDNNLSDDHSSNSGTGDCSGKRSSESYHRELGGNSSDFETTESRW